MRPSSLLPVLLLLSSIRILQSEDYAVEVAIYGGTPPGIAAALVLGRAGKQVLLIEPYSWIGGHITNGLTHSEYHAYEALTGEFLRFTKRVEAHYLERYGSGSPQVVDCRLGTMSEPSVNRIVFERMLAEVPTIRVLTRRRLQREPLDTETRDDSTVLKAITLTSDGQEVVTVRAAAFIDATYEGDLMALAGERWRVGREGRAEYGESHAPEQGDDRLQAYNFRLTFTNVPDNRVPIPQPAGYRREDFIGILPLLEKGAISAIFTSESTRDAGIYKTQIPSLPNGKIDINDVSKSAVRLSMPGANLGWPDGNVATRQAILTEHLRYNLGLLHFLQNDDSVPARWQQEAREYGLCRDEYTTTAHLPEQFFVREARRMVGRHIYTQRDTVQADGDQRCVLHRDAIAMGEYGFNCHGTRREGALFGGKHRGEFYKMTMPYQIPYGVMVPLKTANLLVPVAMSSSHVGFCALRYEYIWMSLGQAAGHATLEALTAGTSVQAIDVARVQRRLHADGLATIYTSDVPPGHPDFAAVQWWGLLGGLHGLETRDSDDEPKYGKNILGQYHETYPYHAVKLNKPLSTALAQRWTAITSSAGLPKDATIGSVTRGDFIRKAFTTATAGR